MWYLFITFFVRSYTGDTTWNGLSRHCRPSPRADSSGMIPAPIGSSTTAPPTPYTSIPTAQRYRSGTSGSASPRATPPLPQQEPIATTRSLRPDAIGVSISDYPRRTLAPWLRYLCTFPTWRRSSASPSSESSPYRVSLQPRATTPTVSHCCCRSSCSPWLRQIILHVWRHHTRSDSRLS
jgi:hypothetical protein